MLTYVNRKDQEAEREVGRGKVRERSSVNGKERGKRKAGSGSGKEICEFSPQ
jgi:hypothetical protein